MGTANKQEERRWYVLTTLFRKEVKVRDDMRRLGFDCYVPMKYELKQIGTKKKRKFIPAINDMVFVNSTKTAIDDYLKQCRETVFFRTSGRKGHHELLTIPDRDMENFMKVTQQVEEKLSYYRPEEIKLSVGDKIIVHGGAFDGVEGILVRLPGKRNKQLVVSIPDISIVAVSLSPELVELVDQPVKKSTDIDGDMKLLFQLAYEKLFAAPNRITQENEYNILIAELRRTLLRVQPFKGYTAQRQAELALPVYMATKALDLDDNTATLRLLSAVNALKETSMLRLRLQLYYALLSPNAELLETIKAQVEKWKQAPLSEQQRLFKDELSQLLNRIG